MGIGIVPSVAVSYDFHYNNHHSNGWNSIEPGIDMPVKLSTGLILNLGAHYSHPLSSVQDVNNGKSAYWFTASLQYSFPNPEPAPAITQTGAGDKKTVVPLIDSEGGRRWHITTGAGIRNFSSNFNVGSAPGFFDGQSGSGDLFAGTAGRNAVYNNGSVLSQSNPYFAGRGQRLGDADFVVNSQSQVRNLGADYVQQVTFNSDRYTSVWNGGGFSQKDTDSAVSPFVSLGYDVLQSDGWNLSVGVGYAYARASMESGVRAINESAKQDYSFIYNVNPVWNSKLPLTAPYNSQGLYQYSLVYDGAQVIGALANAQVPNASNLGNLSPQTVVTTTPVVAFRGARLDKELHSLAIPFDLTVDITKRLSARLSVGPTLNFFDIDLSTATDYQMLDSTSSNGISVYGDVVKSPVRFVSGYVNLDALSGANLQPSSITNIPVTNSVTAIQSTGKGSNSGQTRGLPGTNLAHSVVSKSEQKFQVGAFAEVALRLDLDARKRWYAELYGRFDYVPKFSISDGITTANIDCTSVGAGAGVGFRF